MHLGLKNDEHEFRFMLLLACLFGALIIPPYFAGHEFFSLISKAVLSVVLLASIYSVMELRRLWVPAVVLLVPAITSIWIEQFSDQNRLAFYIHNLTTIAFLSFIGYHFLKHLLGCKTVTINVIYASMCLYLMLAFIWAAIYANIHLFYGGAFNFSNDYLIASTSSEDFYMGTFTYFSFVTLSTLGYGDITPANNVAGAWVAVEAMIGQFYIAIIMARLVSLHAANKVTENI